MSVSNRALRARAQSRRLLAFAALGLMSSLAPAAYPDKPIKIMVPWSPGGATDQIARLLAPPLSQAMGVPVIVENKAGAGGVVSRIDADGRVLTQRLGDADLKAIHIAPSDDYSGLGYASGVGGQIWITEDSGWTWKKGPNVGRTILGVDEIGLGHN